MKDSTSIRGGGRFPPGAPPPLIVYVGGGGDRVTGIVRRVSGESASLFPAPHTPVWLGWWPSGAIRRLLEAAPRPLVLVGHSYGGAAAARACGRVAAPVDLLVTLDPVSRLGPRRRRPEGVRRWVNVHVPGVRDRGDVIAAVGGKWGEVRAADVNVASARARHAHARGMLLLPPVRAEVERVLVVR